MCICFSSSFGSGQDQHRVPVLRKVVPLGVTFLNYFIIVNINGFLNLETIFIFTETILIAVLPDEVLEEADKFIAKLVPKAARKVFYNIDLAEQSNDPKLFKKMQKDIWEFRTNFGGQQIRLLAFWDKDDEIETLVFATHGFIKKVDKVPANEIERAINIRKKYFESKLKK